MNDLTKLIVAGAVAGTLALTGCDRNDPAANDDAHAGHDHAHDDHDHAHDGDDHDHDDAHMDEDHHDEVSLGTVRFGDHDVQLAQGHGELAAGKELHLVVKLPYSDNGASVIRAWLGTEDRFASIVAKGVYAASHDDYDLHAVAPDPLPENIMWWIEIEKPDGTKLLGSVKPN